MIYKVLKDIKSSHPDKASPDGEALFTIYKS